MMPGPSAWALAVRRPDGEIAQVDYPISVLARHRWMRIPVVRGVVALGESLAIGFRGAGDLGELRGPGARGGRRARAGADADTAHLRVRDRDRLRDRPVQGLAGADLELAPGRRHVVRDRRGADPRRHLRRLPDVDPRCGPTSAASSSTTPPSTRRSTPARPAIRSSPRPSSATAPARALRHRFPPVRHGDRHLRVRLLRRCPGTGSSSRGSLRCP